MVRVLESVKFEGLQGLFIVLSVANCNFNEFCACEQIYLYFLGVSTIRWTAKGVVCESQVFYFL